MGAFGRYLQAHIGGTKHDVSTWDNNPKKVIKKSKEQIQEENLEYDEDMFDGIIGSSESLLKRFKQMLKLLENEQNPIENNLKTKEYKNKLSKWKKQFLVDLAKC